MRGGEREHEGREIETETDRESVSGRETERVRRDRGCGEKRGKETSKGRKLLGATLS